MKRRRLYTKFRKIRAFEMDVIQTFRIGSLQTLQIQYLHMITYTNITKINKINATWATTNKAVGLYSSIQGMLCKNMIINHG